MYDEILGRDCPLSVAQVDAIFDTLPGGPRGFCREWGYLHFAKAVLDAARPKWQPIETAPRDGSRVLLRFANGAVAVAYWGWGVYTNAEWLAPALPEPSNPIVYYDPCEWMPLCA